ncbi:MAG: transposase [Actinomycetota bacterium]|nr:transposase [Actinomycetota bacterium]
MPRKPRIDAKGFLYHVIARGIERSEIFHDDKDRDFFLSRLGELLKKSNTPIYAFSLMPNHFHLLLRREGTPISALMRRLLTGYAIYFNKKYSRSGHLFQNRYKATICQDDPYFLELIRYIHLNPIRANLVTSIKELECYPFCGHSYVLGKTKTGWFFQDAILSHFGKTEKRAKHQYLEFVSDGLLMGKRKDLVGGGLKRSLGYPREYPKIKQAFDDRVLGEGSFVEGIHAASPEQAAPKINDPDPLFSAVCSVYNVTRAELLGVSKKKRIAEARANLAYRMSKELGYSGSDIARALLASESSVSRMIRKGELLFEQTGEQDRQVGNNVP